MNEFLRSGSKVLTRPAGLEYELEPSVIYSLKYDNWEGDVYLELGDNVILPASLYKTEEDTKFINKVLNHFDKTTKRTTGVVLTGLKGSGKTVMSKVIAKESNLPIIIVDPTFPTRYLDKFFSKFKDTKVCIVFDEIDKNERLWSTEDLLGFLDGIKSTSKKLVLLTCNSDSKLNEFIKDRCSRIRYCKTFDALTRQSIEVIANNVLNDKKEIKSAVDFILEQFKVISYDNVVSFLEELNDYEVDTYEEIVKDLNISVKNAKQTTGVSRTKREDNGNEDASSKSDNAEKSAESNIADSSIKVFEQA